MNIHINLQIMKILPLTLAQILLLTVTVTVTLTEPLRNRYFIGADIFRLNFSHGEHQQKADLVKIIRAIEKKYDHPIAILADLQVSKCRSNI